MPDTLKKSVAIQRTSLRNMLIDPMRRIADEIADVWGDKAKLDQALMDALPTVPYATYLYALTPSAIQISDNASREGLISRDFARDRSTRPYLQPPPSTEKMSLSEAYISLRNKRPSVTAIQPVFVNGECSGFLGADVDLRDLPLTRKIYEEPQEWQQLKGDPSIRSHVFHQTRADSKLDKHIDDILPVIEELMTESGVFHGKIHFSSSRATIWHLDDPYRFRILSYDALVDPDICLAYPHRPYPKTAEVPQEAIRPILDTFKHLRFADETIYLRAGSVNIFNGIVGLNFSCDGSHYIPYHQFLAKDSAFWEGMD